jgi:hypothetical protein
MKPNHHEIGVGATQELNLRVSVGVLVSVLFKSPEDGRTMLALERTATLRQIEGRSEVIVKAKPFGGAVRLINPRALKELIGNFYYDSERSREQEDFRIQIRPASWETIKEICRKQLDDTEKGILDSSPQRELAEEFEDTLHIRITPEQYQLKSQGMMIENLPAETDNVRAEGLVTVRVYFMFEAWMQDPEIISMMLVDNKQYSDKDLEKMAWKDAQQGGRGRANAILALGFDELKAIYRSMPADRRGGQIRVEEHQLNGNVLALLEDIDHPKYQRYAVRNFRA